MGARVAIEVGPNKGEVMSYTDRWDFEAWDTEQMYAERERLREERLLWEEEQAKQRKEGCAK